MTTCGITRRFRRLPPTPGQLAHVFLTRPPRKSPEGDPVRLACIRHAASVDPEPGSNSPPVRPPHGRFPCPSEASVLCVVPPTDSAVHCVLARNQRHPRTSSGAPPPRWF